MTRTNRMKTFMAAGLFAAAGLAAPAIAQHSSTTISVSDGDVEGESIRIIDGMRYKIVFDDDGVHTAFINGDEAEFKTDDDEQIVYIIKDDGFVEFEIPEFGVGGNAFAIHDGDGRGIAMLPQGGIGIGNNNFFTARGNPPTMVGLTQSTLDDQLREHLDLDDGVGTIILSVVEDLPAADAGLEEGDVLIGRLLPGQLLQYRYIQKGRSDRNRDTGQAET